jgi:hypothetical protein
LSKITSALTPTPRRTELGNEIRVNVDVLSHVRDLLFDPAVVDPAVVRRSVEGFLRRKLARAPVRGKGARKRRFLERCLATAKRARRGLYVCYRESDVDHTSNLIENANGRTKHHLRRIAGRASTAGGPFESYGELLVPVVVEVKLHGSVALLRERVASVTPEAYAQARAHMKELAEPARQHRSVARQPAKFLDGLVERARAARAALGI